MYKVIKFIKTATAGNITAYFLGDNKSIQKRNIIKEIFDKQNVTAEQYAF
jgi:hypothetical protein